VLLTHMVPPLAAIRERRERFAAKPREIVEILHAGTKKAREYAKKTMDEVRSVINLEPK
jgi:tryptophanyl-tRNA synthetase